MLCKVACAGANFQIGIARHAAHLAVQQVSILTVIHKRLGYDGRPPRLFAGIIPRRLGSRHFGLSLGRWRHDLHLSVGILIHHLIFVTGLGQIRIGGIAVIGIAHFFF